jgi:arylsulfatase
VERTAPAAFTARETFDVGTDLGPPVSPEYSGRAPFRFTGRVNTVTAERK